ncbi:glycosyl transferase [Parahaliea aestuarii]
MAATRYRQLAQQAIARRHSGTGNCEPDQLIVSLTSFPRRIDQLHLCIESLLSQSLPPDRVVLWLSRQNFPRQQQELPQTLRALCRWGLDIQFRDGDIGPYKKIIYALQDYPSSLVITVDDDILYPADLVAPLYRAWQAQPDVIHCHRGHDMLVDATGMPLDYTRWRLGQGEVEPSLNVFPTGVGGVLYFPGALHPEVTDSEQFLRLCPRADDVWLKAMSLLQGTRCAVVPGGRHWKERFLTIPGSQQTSLKRENWRQRQGNDDKLRAVFEVYDLALRLRS